MKIFPKTLLFIIGGFLAGFISLLILASISGTSPVGNTTQIIFNSTTEELVKLLILVFILKNIYKLSITTSNTFIAGIMYGSGFTLFEFFLRSLNKAVLIPEEILLVLFIHITTSILLILASHFFLTKKSIKKLSTNHLFYLILAILIHLCYNLTIKVMP